MVRFSADPVTAAGQSLAPNALVPRLFFSAINEIWIQHHSNGIILELLCQSRSGSEWVQLGNHVMRLLRSLGGYTGVAIEGTCPIRLLLRWATRFSFDELDTKLELKIETVRHPLGNYIGARNAIWISYAPDSVSSWTRRLWSDTTSHLFDQDCDMLVAFYSEPPVSNFPVPDPLSLPIFEQSLESAVAWMLPLDDNIGFVVGLPVGSDVYTDKIAPHISSE